MMYQKVYTILEQRQRHVAGFRYDDRSGWRARPQTYISHCHPLWIIAEDKATRRRIWITQSGTDMKITVGRTDEKGGNLDTISCRTCRKKSELADHLRRILYEEVEAA